MFVRARGARARVGGLRNVERRGDAASERARGRWVADARVDKDVPEAWTAVRDPKRALFIIYAAERDARTSRR